MGYVLSSHIYNIAGDDLPGEPGDLEHACIHRRFQNIKTFAEALGGGGSQANHVDTRNVPESE